MYQAPRPDFGVVPSWEPGGSASLVLGLKTVTLKLSNKLFLESPDHAEVPARQLWVDAPPPDDLGRGNRGLGGVSGAPRAGHSPQTPFLPEILKVTGVAGKADNFSESNLCFVPVFPPISKLQIVIGSCCTVSCCSCDAHQLRSPPALGSHRGGRPPGQPRSCPPPPRPPPRHRLPCPPANPPQPPQSLARISAYFGVLIRVLAKISYRVAANSNLSLPPSPAHHTRPHTHINRHAHVNRQCQRPDIRVGGG